MQQNISGCVSVVKTRRGLRLFDGHASYKYFNQENLSNYYDMASW